MIKNNQKIILISYLFSSKYATGGMRAQKFVKYLPTFGYEPIVITRKINDPYRFDGRCILVRTIPINWPFHLESFTWIPELLIVCLKLIRREKVRFVLFSCGPFPDAVVGVILKAFFGVRLILDYRDYWTPSPYIPKTSARQRLINHLLGPLERWVLKSTDRLILVQKEMEEVYLRKFPLLRGKTEVIYNGFDEEDIPERPCEKFRKFTLSYVGNLHLDLNPRYPMLFVESLQKMKRERQIDESNFQVFLVGERFELFEEKVAELGLTGMVKALGRLPHRGAVRYLLESHLLLLIVETEGIITSKIFEYLATGRPILALIRPGELMELIQEFSPDSVIVTSYDPGEVVRGIERCLERMTRDPQGNNLRKRFRRQYDRRTLTAQLVEVVDALAEEG